MTSPRPLLAAVWVVTGSLGGYLMIDWGPTCDTAWAGTYAPLTGWAARVCGGAFPFTPTVLAFTTTGFLALALIVQRPAGRRGTTALGLMVAALPLVTTLSLWGSPRSRDGRIAGDGSVAAWTARAHRHRTAAGPRRVRNGHRPGPCVQESVACRVQWRL